MTAIFDNVMVSHPGAHLDAAQVQHARDDSPVIKCTNSSRGKVQCCPGLNGSILTPRVHVAHVTGKLSRRRWFVQQLSAAAAANGQMMSAHNIHTRAFVFSGFHTFAADSDTSAALSMFSLIVLQGSIEQTRSTQHFYSHSPWFQSTKEDLFQG